MRRYVKNIISIGIIILMLVGIYLTMNSFKNDNMVDFMNILSNMENRKSNKNFNNQDNNINKFRNKRGNRDNMIPNEENDNDFEREFKGPSMDNDTPPSMDDEIIPEMNFGMMNPPDINNNFSINNNSKLTTIHYVIFAFNSLIISVVTIYLIMSNFNKKAFKEIFQDSLKLIIAILCSIILAGTLTFICINVANKYFINNNFDVNIRNELPYLKDNNNGVTNS